MSSSSSISPDTATTNTAVVQTAIFLTKLPAEVRLEVYREVFRGIELFWWHFTESYTPSNRPDGEYVWDLHEGDPFTNAFATLWVSRQVREEAMPVFHHTVRHHMAYNKILTFPTSHVFFPPDRIRYIEVTSNTIQDINIDILRRVFPHLNAVVLNYDDAPSLNIKCIDSSVSFEEFSKDRVAQDQVMAEIKHQICRKRFSATSTIAFDFQCGLDLNTSLDWNAYVSSAQRC